MAVLAVASSIVTLLFARNSSAPAVRSLDWPGQVTIAITLFCLQFAVIQGSTSGWGSSFVIGGFVVAAVFFVLFIVVERRSSAPLLRWNPRWLMGVGFLLMSAGDFWMAVIPASTMSLSIVVAPLLLIGTGFAFAISSITAVAVNAVPNHLTGMASDTTSLMRDFGFTLGPAVIGSIALRHAATEVRDRVAASTAVQDGLARFNASVASAPAAEKSSIEGAIGAVNSGSLGANGVPATVTLPTGQTVPFNPLKNIAFAALDNAFSLGYVVCGLAALVAAVLAIIALGGGSAAVLAESLADDRVE